MFHKFFINTHQDIFSDLSSCEFEQITHGRKGANLCINNSLVRTTTKYKLPNQPFGEVHHDLINKIKSIKSDVRLNNALVEIYDDDYRSMGYHSDQALDLENDSYICIFSCYDKPGGVRKLIIKNKTTNKESEVVMDHSSVIVFSTQTNKEFLHKIILDECRGSRWLGVTFRLSKTFVEFINGVAHINKKILRLANEDETREFYKLRSRENREINYLYPDIDYTISPGDI